MTHLVSTAKLGQTERFFERARCDLVTKTSNAPNLVFFSRTHRYLWLGQIRTMRALGYACISRFGPLNRTDEASRP